MKKQILFLALIIATGFSSLAQTNNVGTSRIFNPVSMVAGIEKEGKITKERIAATRTVDAASTDLDSKVSFKVTSFTLSIYRDQFDPIVLTSASNQITDEMHKALAECESGAVIYFEYVRCAGADGLERKIEAVKLIIE
jgi:hypothetical protein